MAYIIIVSVLQELFGAVGSLVSVKLENSVAEVVFVKATDANSAYRKYHNRMLDGELAWGIHPLPDYPQHLVPLCTILCVNKPSFFISRSTNEVHPGIGES